MTAKQQAGQLACLGVMDAALRDLARATIITGVGLRNVEAITEQLTVLRLRVMNAKVDPAPPARAKLSEPIPQPQP